MPKKGICPFSMCRLPGETGCGTADLKEMKESAIIGLQFQKIRLVFQGETTMKTIKGKLILYFSAVILVMTIALSMFYLYQNYRNQRRELIQNANSNMEYFQSNINRMLERCSLLSDKIYFNRNVAKILIRDYRASSTQNLDRDLLEALRDISGYLSNDIISSYATAILVSGNNGETITYGVDADYFSMKSLLTEEWFQENRSNSNVKWLPIIENRSGRTTSRYYIPMVRKCISVDGRKEIGWHFIAVSTSMIRDMVKDYPFHKGEILIICDANNRCVYCSNDEISDEEIGKLICLDPSEEMVQIGNTRWFAAHSESEYSGLKLLQLVSYSNFASQIRSLFLSSSVILFFAAATAIILTVLLSTYLSRPINRIIHKMEQISEGDFSVDENLNGTDEIGKLGQGVNFLAQNVENLMINAREEERRKKEYEYKALQSQINPHFVYNVLNSIRVMARLQGAENIANLTESFGGLLKEISKGVDDKIPITEEFELARKYLHLQNIRLKGMLSVRYEIEQGCENYLILKFLLQPLIENSVLHGLEDKRGSRKIEIRAFRRDDCLCISIWDNGQGMTPDEITNLMTMQEKKNIGHYNQVGVRNVLERIHLLYGQQYGLCYESIKGEYTKATVTLPVETAGNQEKELSDV